MGARDDQAGGTTAEAAQQLSGIGLYIHVPYCRHACPYCDFYKVELGSRPAGDRLAFPRRIARELELALERWPTLAGRPLDTIYLGGGTPSTLKPESVAVMLTALRGHFPPGDPEVTLEANPENLTPRRCEQWREAGINRLSMGVQSFAEEDLGLLERLHEPATITTAVANARRAGFENFSLDLMFALPGQTLAAWLENLRRAVDLGPAHMSFYGLTWHEGTPFADWLAAGRLAEADEDLQAAMYLEGTELLEGAGFEHYEVSNFARPGRRSCHNQRYWRRADVLALGPGAHGNLGDERFSNPEDLDRWGAAVDGGRLCHEGVEHLAPEGAAAERLYTLLRRREGISRAEDPELFARVGAWLSADGMEASGWLEAGPERLAMRKRGWLVLDALVERIMVFSDGRPTG